MQQVNKTILIVFLTSLFIVAQKNNGEQVVSKSDEFRHSINMCPLGIAFGVYSANYEYMITKTHGIVFRLDYEDIPDTYSDAKINVNGKAAVLNYRYHCDEKLGSFYLGAYGRYRIYEGDGNLNSQKFDFDIKDFTVGLNAGKKWVWDSGFNINFTLGYGYTFRDKTQSLSSTEINKSIKVFEDDYAFIDAFLGEFSIGYAF